MPTNPLPEALPDPTVRFPLRSLIVGTTCAAVVAAIAGPYYRAASPAAKAELLAFWGVILAMAAMYALGHWWAAYQRSLSSGPTRYRLQRPDGRRLWMIIVWGMTPFPLSWSVAALFSALMFVGNTAWLAHPRQTVVDAVGGQLFLGLIIGLVFWGAVSAVWSQCASQRWIRICDYGVVVDRRVIPWGSVLHGSWHLLHPSWLMISTWTRPFAVEVPTRLHDEVEAFVAERTRFDDADSKLAPGQ